MLAGAAVIAPPAFAVRAMVSQVDKNPNGSLTYHFAVMTDPGETLSPGDAKTPGTRQVPAVPGGIVTAATLASTSPKQAVIGSLPTLSFLADTDTK